MTDHHKDMVCPRRQTAVCILRVERQRTGLLITLAINPNIEKLSTERTHRTSEIDTAMMVIRDFLVEFTREVPS